MCGLTGFWQKEAFARGDELKKHLISMTDAIANRGPDSFGYWFSKDERVAFGHRRLAIMDVSEAGHQPMLSSSSRFVILFNGQIYNAEDIRKDLPQGCVFRGHSDTEVMLAAFEAWGIEKSIERFIGMFAIVLYDTAERKIYLIRDRVGVKPLYYSVQNDVLFFGSQVKSLQEHPRFQGEINPIARAEYLTYGVLPAGLSIFKEVQQVEPGTILCFNSDLDHTSHTYWSMVSAYDHAQKNPLQLSDQGAVAHFESLIADAVRLRMTSDVPLGAFLSGGIDSSLVVALMQEQSSQKVKTFTIGFHEDGFNEAKYAKEVAHHLGTDHHELYLTAKDALSVIPTLPKFYDEPFADSSQIPTYLVSHFARQHVTVALSGDGGDEFFAGYTRYTMTEKILKILRLVPLPARSVLAAVMRRTSASPLAGRLESLMGQSFLFDKLHKASFLMGLKTPFEVYGRTLQSWSLSEVAEITDLHPQTHKRYDTLFKHVYDLLSAMQMCDAVGYLTDDIMTKVDRASMAVSLEGREPLLDHRIIEQAWRLPTSQKLRDGKGKWVLRQILGKHVPNHLFERPKQGFGIPLHQWLRSDLKDWAEDLLSDSMLKKHGFENTPLITERWNQHKSGQFNWHTCLWAVLMYQSWAEQRISHKS